MQPLIQLLIYMVIFAIVAYTLYWICVKFFPGFPPALWLCGAVLLIIALLFIAGQVAPGSMTGILPHTR